MRPSSHLPVVLLLGALLLGACGDPADERPHIVILLWDTTRADRLHCYGDENARTPWLDGVAADGRLWEQCRPASTWTLPSHASLFTGRVPSRHGATAIDSPLAPAHDTLAEDLAASGYDTILVSCNGLVGRRTGLAQGFAVVKEIFSGHERPTALQALESLEEELAVRRNDPVRSGKPLFLFVNLMEPHLPYDAGPTGQPSPVEGLSDEEFAALRGFQFPMDMAHNLGVTPLSATRIEGLSHLYDDGIAAVDAASARFETLLRRDGILPDPKGADGGRGLLVVTSDHGENLGEHGLVDHKLSVHETLLRIPLVLRWPGHVAQGRESDPVRLQDLHPTLRIAAGLEAARDRQVARDLLAVEPGGRPSLIQSPAPSGFVPSMRRTFPSATDGTFDVFHRGLEAAVSRDGRWKWVRSTWDDDRAEPVEFLYDLETDSAETTSVITVHPQEAGDLRRWADEQR